MAPKKAKKENAPVQAGGGLQRFFGGSKSAAPAPSKAAEEPPLAPMQDTKPEAPMEDTKPAASTTPTESSTPVKAEEAAPPAKASAEQASSGGLTDLQKQRIEDNRRKALERKALAQKKGETPTTGSSALAAPAAPTSSPPEAPAAPAKSAGNWLSAKTSTTKKDVKPSAKAPAKRTSVDGPGKQVSDEDHVTPAKKTPKKDTSDISPEKTPCAAKTGGVPAAAALQGPPEKFSTFGRVPWKQYNHLYAVRLRKLQGPVLHHAQAKWGSGAGALPAAAFLNDIGRVPSAAVSNGGSDVVVVGLVCRDLQGRDNVIERYQNSKCVGSLPEDEGFTTSKISTDGDTLWLEDAISRIQLEVLSEHMARLSTGFVIGVRGCYTESGKLRTKDICMAQSLVPSPLPAVKGAASGSFVAFLSGLFIGAPDEDIDARTRAVDFLLGKDSACHLSQAIQRVMVCGGIYAVPEPGDVPAGIADADALFAQLAEKLPVTVLPGRQDPSNLSLPQLPMFPHFFRTAQKLPNFKSATNPYECTWGGLQVMGHSGQPTQDLVRCTSIKTPLEALTTCLDACLLAPTAPDTLGTQPFHEVDPFIIEKVPQIIFAGGHSQVEYEWREAPGSAGTLCVCIPAFNQQASVVLVNLNDPKDVRVQRFGAQ